MQSLGKILIIAGILLIVAGVVIFLAGNKLSWLGHLPGDIRVERENFRFYFPVTTMIILSVVLSILVKLFKKFFN